MSLRQPISWLFYPYFFFTVHLILKILFSHFQLCLLIIHLLLKQCRSLPKECSLTNLRSRYMLVSKRSNPASTQSNGNSFSSSKSSKCPWTWVVNRKDDRFPREIVHAKCGNACDEWYCRPVRYNMIVLYRKKGSLDKWKMRNKRITVAYVYTK